MALTGLLIAAAAGAAKSKLIDEPQADRARKLASETQRYSPWTHLKANPVQEPNMLGTAMQYGAAGAQMGANIKAAGGSGNPYGSGGYGNQGIANYNNGFWSGGDANSMGDYNSSYFGKNFKG